MADNDIAPGEAKSTLVFSRWFLPIALRHFAIPQASRTITFSSSASARIISRGLQSTVGCGQGTTKCPPLST